jgi:hypothetical protein
MTIMQLGCSELKEMVAGYLVENLRSSPSLKAGCTLTLPIKSVDDRWVFVVVEEKYNVFLVHDAGKTDSALFSYGLKMADSDTDFIAGVARKYGVSVENRTVQKLCGKSELAAAVVAVAEAATVMSAQLISSRIAEAEAQQVHSRISEILHLWKPNEFVIAENSEVETDVTTHKFNFIARDKASVHTPTTIKILPPSNPRDRAERYGFMLYDMKEDPRYSGWSNLAVVTGADKWSAPALDIVKRMATRTVEITPQNQNEIESSLARVIEDLTASKPELHL